MLLEYLLWARDVLFARIEVMSKKKKKKGSIPACMKLRISAAFRLVAYSEFLDED